MKKIIFLTLLLSSFLYSGVYTKKDVKVYEGVGYGSTRQEAVNNALAEAVEQINGVVIAKSVYSEDLLVETDKENASAFVYDTKIKKITAGKVDSYKIESVTKGDDGRYEAVVSVTKTKVTHKYKAPGHNPKNRRALAVIPFEFKKSYSIYGVNIPGEALSMRLNQAVVTKFTQTRKFTVLDRENSKYYEFEKSFLLSGNSQRSELARLGQRLGVDYFVIGQIVDFAIERESQTNYYTSQTTSSDKAYATISYRILNVPTQQIKWAETIDISFDLPKKKRAESIILKASDTIAQEIVDRVLNNIFPPKVIEVSHKNAIVNMGGNVIHVGEKYKVFRYGKKLYDPYTKEYLGRDEIEVGTVEITKVLPKISYAKILSGKVKKGNVLRKEASQNSDKVKANDDSEGKGSMFDAMFPQP
jgi:TolB-like protein